VHKERERERCGERRRTGLAIWRPMPLVAPVTIMETPSSGGSWSGLVRWLAAMRWKKNSPTMASQPRPHSIHPSSSLFPLSSPPEGEPASPLEEEEGAAAASPSGASGRRRRRSPAMRKEEGRESLTSVQGRWRSTPNAANKQSSCSDLSGVLF
jgi:hypothetical protein